MAIKRITLRAFLSEISSSIVSANERLLQESFEEQTDRQQEIQQAKASPLEIKTVRVSFSARVSGRKLGNLKPAKQDEILLDFATDNKYLPQNIYGEMEFSGKGEPLEPLQNMRLVEATDGRNTGKRGKEPSAYDDDYDYDLFDGEDEDEDDDDFD